MRISDFLCEYNEQRLINDFGTKLVTRAAKDPSAPNLDVPSELIQEIATLDPTPNKDLTFWIAFQYTKFSKETESYGINRWEDIASRAIPNLLKFKALIKKPNLNPPLPVRDMNKIQGLAELVTILAPYTEKDTTSNSKKDEMYFKNGQAELIHDDKDIRVVSPLTVEASQYFGVNTQWCTAAKEDNMFEDYIDDGGKLFIVLIKKENKRYQFEFNSNQFMDEQDDAINPRKLADKYPILWKIFSPISEKNNSLAMLKDSNENMICKIVSKNPLQIKWVARTASEKVQLAAVSAGNVIYEIVSAGITPSEAVQLAAVRQSADAFRYISGIANEEVKEAAVINNAWNIQYVSTPSEKIQLLAVVRVPQVLQFLRTYHVSDEVYITAITTETKNHPFSDIAKFIVNPSEKLQIKLIKINPWCVRYLHPVTDMALKYAIKLMPVIYASFKRNDIIASHEVALYAVQCDPLNYNNVPSYEREREDIQLAAVSGKGMFIKGMKNQTPELQMAAVKQNPIAVAFIPNPTEDVQRYILKNALKFVTYIKNPIPAVKEITRKYL